MAHNTGRLIDKKLGINIFNTKSYALKLSYFYKQLLKVINKYNFGKYEILTMNCDKFIIELLKKVRF